MRVGEALVLPLGMWSECFAHTRGGAGAVLRGRRAVGRRAGAARPRPAPPRWQALPATHCLGGRAPGLRGGGRRDARRASRPRTARPCPPPPGPAQHARPAPSRWQGRRPSAQGPAASLCRGGRAGAGGRGRTAGAGAGGGAAVGRLRARPWPWPGPHLFVERLSIRFIAEYA